MKTLAIVMMIVGAVLIGINGFNYFTREKVIDVGQVEVNHDVSHFIHWSPAAGVFFLVGGIVVFAIDRNKKTR